MIELSAQNIWIIGESFGFGIRILSSMNRSYREAAITPFSDDNGIPFCASSVIHIDHRVFA
jgi:hypothetical protein